jgi:hypothetical protein
MAYLTAVSSITSANPQAIETQAAAHCISAHNSFPVSQIGPSNRLIFTKTQTLL